MISNKFISNLSKRLFVIIFAFVLWSVVNSIWPDSALHNKRKTIVEPFSIDNKKLIEINDALDSIVACQQMGKSFKACKDVADFTQFKKKLGYPNFNASLFNQLLNKRIQKKEHLTQTDINGLVTKAYEKSFV